MPPRIPDHVREAIKKDIEAGHPQYVVAERHGVSRPFVCTLLGRSQAGKFPPRT
jgi:hypothetical protein